MKDILFQNVNFSYPNNPPVLVSIDLKINGGEQIAVIGHNGTGKSTFAKLINGLLHPSDGVVWIGDMNTKNYTTAHIAANVGYVFQNPDDQIFHSTVEKEIGFCKKIIRKKRQNIKVQIEEAIQMTGLQKYRAENPFDLPVSMRRFVAMASVLAMDPNILIFDEPTAGQDAYGRNLLKNIFQKLKEKKKTVITISHDIEFVLENFQKLIIMANRGILFYGESQNALQTPELFQTANLELPYINKLCMELGIPGTTDLVQAAQKMYDNYIKM